MVIPNYTYLKLKMLGPNGVITVGSTFSHAYTCDREHYKLATTVINSFELPRLRELSTPAVLDYNKPTSLTAFCPLEETKALGIDPTNPTKMVRIETQLPAKSKYELTDFLCANSDVFAWKPSDMPGIPREVAEHALRLILGSKPSKQHLHH